MGENSSTGGPCASGRQGGFISGDPLRQDNSGDKIFVSFWTRQSTRQAGLFIPVIFNFQTCNLPAVASLQNPDHWFYTVNIHFYVFEVNCLNTFGCTHDVARQVLLYMRQLLKHSCTFHLLTEWTAGVLPFCWQYGQQQISRDCLTAASPGICTKPTRLPSFLTNFPGLTSVHAGKILVPR